jgi:hypothetical protein
MEDFRHITEMSRALRCAFFAGFAQVETLVLGRWIMDDPFDRKHLSMDCIASLPQLRILEIRWCWYLSDEERQITSETHMCHRNIELRLIYPSIYLLEWIVASSLSHHIHHLSLQVSKFASGGRDQETVLSLRQLLKNIGPRLTYLSLTLDDWTASQNSE